MKNTKSKIKPIKIEKQSGTTYFFWSQEVKMTNKVLREKSHCVAFRFNKSKISKTKSKLTTVVTVL